MVLGTRESSLRGEESLVSFVYIVMSGEEKRRGEVAKQGRTTSDGIFSSRQIATCDESKSGEEHGQIVAKSVSDLDCICRIGESGNTT